MKDGANRSAEKINMANLVRFFWFKFEKYNKGFVMIYSKNLLIFELFYSIATDCVIGKEICEMWKKNIFMEGTFYLKKKFKNKTLFFL